MESKRGGPATGNPVAISLEPVDRRIGDPVMTAPARRP